MSRKKVDDVIGIDSILLKLEFGADTKLGSRVSDIGASFNVVKYYDLTEKSLDSAAVASEYYKSLDDYEKSNIDRINRMLMTYTTTISVLRMRNVYLYMDDEISLHLDVEIFICKT